MPSFLKLTVFVTTQKYSAVVFGFIHSGRNLGNKTHLGLKLVWICLNLPLNLSSIELLLSCPTPQGVWVFWKEQVLIFVFVLNHKNHCNLNLLCKIMFRPLNNRYIPLTCRALLVLDQSSMEPQIMSQLGWLRWT